MKMGKYLLGGIGILAVFVFFAHSSSPQGSGQMADISFAPRADLIKIDGLKAFGGLEKQPVEFLHDVHTRALANKNQDCTFCHLAENGHISQKFMRIRDTDKTTAMNIYHQGCIACHGQMKVANEKTGPVECDGCHTPEARWSSSLQPMGFDKSLHYRHLVAQKNQCENCHHEYDEQNKKLFYAKGKEETCRYCHQAETRKNVTSMRLASHQACIECHRQSLAKKLAAGPVECAGCHDAAVQQNIKKIASVPRMEGKQPDVLLLKSVPEGSRTDLQSLDRMNIVAFDHKAHETYTDTCRGCHHASLQPCKDCHTMAGAKEGNGVNLEKAMHQLGTGKSCQGCHYEQLRNKKCAGCHSSMGAGRKKTEATCSACHMKPLPGIEASSGSDQDKALAAEMLKSRTPASGVYRREDIPETVVIKDLANHYEAVDFPHRRIVDALARDIQGNQLTVSFHPQGAVCQGCHHNSPASKKPPRCASCHGPAFDAENPLKPSIKGAYHLQCMGCHKAMGMAKPSGCTDCHKKKPN